MLIGNLMARGGLSATRATEIIDFLTSRGTTAFTLSEIAKELGINVASTHAILQALTKSGHLSRHPKHKTYTLGPALVAIGHVALRNHTLIARAETAAAELSRSQGVEVLLSMRAGDTVLGLAHFQVDGISRSLLRTGQRVPLHVPFGATLVAWESEAEIEKWIERGTSAKNETDLAHGLRGLLALIRERGYQICLKIDTQGEFKASPMDWEANRYVRAAAYRMQLVHNNFNALSFDPETARENELFSVDFMTVPLFDHHNRAIYALTLYDFERQMSGRDINALLTKLLAMCAAIGSEY